MSGRLTPSWQRRRGELNHDVLKNQFLPALAKCLNVLDDRIEDPEFERTFVPDILPRWETIRAEAVALADTFEAEMSPRGLVLSGPLAGLDGPTRAALAELVHVLWRRRYATRDRVADARRRVADAQAAYEALQADLGRSRPGSDGLRPHRPLVAAFHDACRRLAAAVHLFPTEVHVT